MAVKTDCYDQHNYKAARNTFINLVLETRWVLESFLPPVTFRASKSIDASCN